MSKCVSFMQICMLHISSVMYVCTNWKNIKHIFKNELLDQMKLCNIIKKEGISIHILNKKQLLINDLDQNLCDLHHQD